MSKNDATRAIAEPLTVRQMQFVCMAANGMRHDEIARQEHISPNTVQRTFDLAKERAGVRTIPQLTALCVAAGLLYFEDDQVQIA